VEIVGVATINVFRQVVLC